MDRIPANCIEPTLESFERLGFSAYCLSGSTWTKAVTLTRVLTSGRKPEELLLAHELVTVALKEGDKAARSLFESTWDMFEISIGNPPRYAGHLEPKAVQSILEGK